MRSQLWPQLCSFSVSVISLTTALALAPSVLAESMRPPEPLTIDFATQGCGRLRQQAYYRTEFHFVNICLGEANWQMVVTDNDGLGRERMAATQQRTANGFQYQGKTQNGSTYTITPNTFTIQYPGQPHIQEAVTRAVLTGLAETTEVRYQCASQVATLPAQPNVNLATALKLVQHRENDQFVYRCTVAQPNPDPRPMLQATVTGTVAYRQRIALPPNAVVEVTLQDTSRADAPALVLDRQTIPTNGKQVPIPFTLTYDPTTINPTHTYTVAARILVNGQLQWINTTSYPVITRDNPSNVAIMVEQTRR